MGNLQEMNDPVKNPAWEKYHAARKAWEDALDQAKKHYREMCDAAEELIRGGEMPHDAP